MRIKVSPSGVVTMIYSDDLDLSNLGKAEVSRASTVEPDGHGRWNVDLAPVGGPVIEGFGKRADALKTEVAWLERNRL